MNTRSNYVLPMIIDAWERGEDHVVMVLLTWWLLYPQTESDGFVMQLSPLHVDLTPLWPLETCWANYPIAWNESQTLRGSTAGRSYSDVCHDDRISTVQIFPDTKTECSAGHLEIKSGM